MEFVSTKRGKEEWLGEVTAKRKNEDSFELDLGLYTLIALVSFCVQVPARKFCKNWDTVTSHLNCISKAKATILKNKRRQQLQNAIGQCSLRFRI